MSPGNTVRPRRSCSCVFGRASARTTALLPTSTIRPSRIANASCTVERASDEITFPLWNIASGGGGWPNSIAAEAHPIATVDTRRGVRKRVDVGITAKHHDGCAGFKFRYGAAGGGSKVGPELARGLFRTVNRNARPQGELGSYFNRQARTPAAIT